MNMLYMREMLQSVWLNVTGSASAQNKEVCVASCCGVVAQQCAFVCSCVQWCRKCRKRLVEVYTVLCGVYGVFCGRCGNSLHVLFFDVCVVRVGVL